MRLPSLTDLKARVRERVDSAARGTDVPAGIERDAPAAPSGSRERGRMRRRLRELRRLREAQLVELGALVLEAHRHDRDDSPVIKRKAADAAATDAEARALAAALETEGGLDTVIAAGIAGPCPTCGTLASTTARFCSTCGTPLDGRPDAAPRADATAANAIAGDPHAPSGDAPPAAGSGHAADPDAPATVVETEHAAADPDTPATAAGTGFPPEETTELPAANGDGGSPEEYEATTGGKA